MGDIFVLPPYQFESRTRTPTEFTMTEEEFKEAVQNMLLIQSNNDHNFQVLQAQIDSLQQQLDNLNDLKELFRLPKIENKNREPFQVINSPDG